MAPKVKKKVSRKTTSLKASSKTPTKTSKKSVTEAKRVQAEIIHSPSKRNDVAEDAPGIEELHSFEPEGLSSAPTFTELDPIEDSRLPVPVETDAGVQSTDPVATYLAEIRKYPLLTRDEERSLAVRYRETGDSQAAERLVTANLRFVVKIAAEYSKFGAKLIDLIQEGNVGLMHAVREFNPYKDVRLITYAVWWIRGYIQEYLMRQYSMVRIGTTQTQRKLFYRLQKEKDALDRMGRDPNIQLLASRLGVDEEDVRTMSQRLSGRDVSLSTPLDSENTTTLLDMEASESPNVDEQLGRAEELEVLRENIEKIRPQLNEKELYILENRVLSDEPMTLQEIGEHYGTTREAVRQLEARLIGKIRNAFTKSVEAHPDTSEMDDSE
jgi:RNA polymerase sigma-32 factor